MSNRAKRLASLSAFVAMLVSAQAAAQVKAEFVTGWEGSSARGYAFATPIFSFTRQGPWAGMVRASASYLYYELPGAGGTVEVRSPGQSVGIGLKYSSPRLSLGFGPGYEVRQKHSRTSTGEVRERERGLTVQGEMFFQATPRTQFSTLLSYGKANEYFWGRAGLKRQLTNFDSSGPRSLHLGAEVTSQGNDESEADQLGGMFEVAFPRYRASLQIRSGHQRISYADGSTQSGPYFGVGLYRGF